jgi:hypothetical protein
MDFKEQYIAEVERLASLLEDEGFSSDRAYDIASDRAYDSARERLLDRADQERTRRKEDG